MIRIIEHQTRIPVPLCATRVTARYSAGEDPLPARR